MTVINIEGANASGKTTTSKDSPLILWLNFIVSNYLSRKSDFQINIIY
jgi:uridine kinase